MKYLPENKVYLARVSPALFLIPAVLMAVFLIVSSQFFHTFYRDYMATETGILEGLHILIPGVTFVMTMGFLWRLRASIDFRQKLAFIVLALGCLYIATEEASWGQHYFQWDTTGWFSVHNDQHETNLHNTSSWFDQKPRLLLEIFIILNSIIMPALFLVKGSAVYEKYRFLPLCIPPSLCFIGIIAQGFKWLEGLSFLDGMRISEVNELYYYYFIFTYTICFYKTCSIQDNFINRT